MISYILLIISVVIVIGMFFVLFINYLYYKKRSFDEYSGFDAAKDVTSNYDSINIINSSDFLFSEYDIKRNVIRLNNSNYNGSSYWDVFIASLLAGYSLVNDSSKNYFKFDFLFRKIRCFSIVSIVMIILSCYINNIADARIGCILFVLLTIYQYMRYQIVVSMNSFLISNLSKDVFSKIESIFSRYIIFNKVTFIVSLIMILRLVVIIMGI